MISPSFCAASSWAIFWACNIDALAQNAWSDTPILYATFFIKECSWRVKLYATARRFRRSYFLRSAFFFVRLGASARNCPLLFRANTVGEGLPYLWTFGSLFFVILAQFPHIPAGVGGKSNEDGALRTRALA